MKYLERTAIVLALAAPPGVAQSQSDSDMTSKTEQSTMTEKSKDMTYASAEVGGFLGMADKHVMLSVDDAKLVPVDDASYVFVTRYNEEELESMNGVDEGFWN